MTESERIHAIRQAKMHPSYGGEVTPAERFDRVCVHHECPKQRCLYEGEVGEADDRPLRDLSRRH